MPRDWLIIAVGVVIALAGLWRGRQSIRNFWGNFIGGDASGITTQNYTGQAGGPARPEAPSGDRVAWVLAAIGVLVAVAGIVVAHVDAGH